MEEADGRGRWKRYVENEGIGVTKHEGRYTARPGHLERACHGNTPALLPMKTRLPKRIVPRDRSPSCSSAAAAAYLSYDFRGVAWGLLLGTSFASTKQIVRGIVKGGPALRASMFIYMYCAV